MASRLEALRTAADAAGLRVERLPRGGRRPALYELWAAHAALAPDCLKRCTGIAEAEVWVEGYAIGCASALVIRAEKSAPRAEAAEGATGESVT